MPFCKLQFCLSRKQKIHLNNIKTIIDTVLFYYKNTKLCYVIFLLFLLISDVDSKIHQCINAFKFFIYVLLQISYLNREYNNNKIKYL